MKGTGRDADVDRLTVPGTMPTLIADLTCAANGSYTENYVRALCRRAVEALQSLSQEAVREEVLERALRAIANECGGMAKSIAEAALKREPNNVLAPGERKPGEIAGPTNDTRESARVKSTAIGQVDCASKEQVYNPVEDTLKREPNAAGPGASDD